jgi:hypothetical protein
MSSANERLRTVKRPTLKYFIVQLDIFININVRGAWELKLKPPLLDWIVQTCSLVYILECSCGMSIIYYY